MNYGLKLDSPDEWLETVLANFDEFLVDHAANEKKASAAALSMVAHYPDKVTLVETMVDLALEELNHYRQVLNLTLNPVFSLSAATAPSAASASPLAT